MRGTCLNCQKEFEYSPLHTRGKYCSNQCCGIHTTTLAKAAWYEGTNPHPDRATIRRYLSEDRGYKCEIPECGIGEWLGKPITLQVDHIDGNPADDRPQNVRLICPNCHSQPPFLGNGNKGRGRGSLGIKLN
jgi:5-methylcytosine-specific restriction endonuclease McrA